MGIIDLGEGNAIRIARNILLGPVALEPGPVNDDLIALDIDYSSIAISIDDTHVSFTNLWGMESSIVGVVDFTARTITFPAPTSLGSAYGGQLMVAHIDADGNYDDQPIVAVMSPLGITLKNLGFYLQGGSYDGYDFGEDSIFIYRG